MKTLDSRLKTQDSGLVTGPSFLGKKLEQNFAQAFSKGLHSLLVTILCLACFFFFLPSEAESAFTETGLGVRPLGMGGAFVALADDNSAITFNPAGLGQIGRTEFAAAYDKLYAGLGDDSLGRGYVSYVYPSRSYGALAVNLAFLHTPLYKETTVTFGYGKPIGPLYLGLNTKGLFTYFKENVYTQLDPLFSNDNTSSNGLALDLGMIYKLTNSLSFGLAAINVNEPNMALDEDEDAEVPLTLQTGLALKLGGTASTIDLTYRNKKLNDKRDINVHLGLESWLAGRSVALRGGVNFHDMAVGASYVFKRGNDMDAQIDYAFRYPLVLEDAISDTYGTHQFSLNVRFGGFGGEERPEVVAEATKVEKDQVAADKLTQVAEHRKEGRYEEGIKLCDEILGMELDDEYIVQAHIQMGGMLNQLGRYEEALEQFQAAIGIAPRDPSTHYELGMYYKQYGDRTGDKSWYNKAIIEFEKTRLIDSDFGDVSSEIKALRKKT
jgi:tetratricopeptide (TPR) repeat protein